MAAIDFTDTTHLLRQINLNHMLYFWAVSRLGSVSAAARRLGVSQPSVSEQVRTLETRLGAKLLDRGPRGVHITAAGSRALRFAEEIVGVCADLMRSLPLTDTVEPRALAVGTADSVPKVIVRMLLERVLGGSWSHRVVCREWRVDHLLAELSLHRLDLVISDRPLDETTDESLQSFVAAESPVDLYAARRVAPRFRRLFATRIAELPMLAPAEGTALRASLDRWFAMRRVRPKMLLEAEDRALLHHFAEAGRGVAPIATMTAVQVARQFGLEQVGRLRGVREQFYVIVKRRDSPHPELAQLPERLSQAARVRHGRRRKTDRKSRRG